ncbi:MAG: CpsD/CapB family tyrosine-protein kinase [Planctomycetota bacterium]
MGRIADALKRAEQERRAATGACPGPTAAQVLATAPSLRTEMGEPTPPSPHEHSSDEPISLSEGLSEDLVPFFDRSALVTEQYRSLRTRLLSQNPNYEHRTVAVTSAVPKEGKSVTSLNLACVLAEIRHLKVLVVDGDFRRGSLADMLNKPSAPGLADVFCREATYSEVICDTPIPNLKFIPSGNASNRSAAELWTAANAKPTFHDMRNEFHYTIVDTPPTTSVTDAGIIGQLCSGVIVVVRLHRTNEHAAKRAVRLLQVNNIPITGCLLVGRDAPAGVYGYGYGYGYGYNYHYYKDYYDKKSDDR